MRKNRFSEAIAILLVFLFVFGMPFGVAAPVLAEEGEEATLDEVVDEIIETDKETEEDVTEKVIENEKKDIEDVVEEEPVVVILVEDLEEEDETEPEEEPYDGNTVLELIINNPTVAVPANVNPGDSFNIELQVRANHADQLIKFEVFLGATRIYNKDHTAESLGYPSGWPAPGAPPSNFIVTLNVPVPAGQVAGTYDLKVQARQPEDRPNSQQDDTVTGGVIVGSTTPSDTTPPVTTATLSPPTPDGDNDWYVSPVTVTLTAEDELGGSDVDYTEYSYDELTWVPYTDPVVHSVDAIYTFYFRSVDNAGNIEDAKSVSFKIDQTNPTLAWGDPDSEPNAHGWNNTSVNISYTTEDNLSGVASAVPDSPLIFATEGENQTKTVRVTDFAGNYADFTSAAVNIDLTPPEVTITIPANNASYTLNQVVYADWEATDALSDIDTAVGTVANGEAIDTATVGEKTFTVTATDKAGNQTVVTHTYYVTYDFGGFLPPINKVPGNVFKLRSTIPVKFQLFDDFGVPVSGATASIYVVKYSNSTPPGEPDDTEGESSGAANTGNLFRYDDDDEQYIFNLGTRKLTTGSYRIFVTLDDGTFKFVDIALK